MMTVGEAGAFFYPDAQRNHHEMEVKMDNQHQKIKGYRDLSPAEIELMNKIKDIGETLDATCKALAADPTIDQRWVAIGKTHLQQGIMALVRAVAQPTTF
jgi:hypothetical protein